MSLRVATPGDSKEFEPRNGLLAALPGEDFLCLQPYLEAVPLARGSVLFDVNEPVTRVYFVETGVAALVSALDNRAPIGVATVGPLGAVGVAALLLGGDTEIGRSQVLVPGSALAMEVSAFRSALRQSSKLRRACEACTRLLFVQMLQAAPCNRLHTVAQRCARWLLMCADRTEDETFELTEAGLAEMLGLPHSTVATSALQESGLIGYNRGAITVLDRPGLEAAACECYRIVRDRYDRLLGCPIH